MKKIVLLALAVVMMVSSCLVFTGCGESVDTGAVAGGVIGEVILPGVGGVVGNIIGQGETKYVATTDFYYSDDKGHTYGNATKEYEVGETVYMQVKTKVTTNKKKPQTITMKLTIPNITAVDAKYYDGQPITPTYDALKNVTTYEFTITAAEDAQEWSYVFQFIPNAESEVRILLEFDDNVESMYDKQNTIKFVAPKENVGE